MKMRGRESDREEALLQVLRGGAFYAIDELERSLNCGADDLARMVDELRSRGYDIERRPGSGYRMVGTPELVLPADIRAGLHTEVVGGRIVGYGRVGSTNAAALELARRGAPEGTLVIADHQTRGRGRLGRRWESPPGAGIWMSLILRPAVPPERAPAITLVAAASVTQAIRAVGLPVLVRWPNDVIVASGRKICGILSEMEGAAESVQHIVVGIGINVNQRPDDFDPSIRGTATSLFAELGRTVPRPDLAAGVLNDFDTAYHRFCRGGLAPLLPRIRECSSLLGEHVAVWIEKQEVFGQVLDIDDWGRLVLRDDHGMIQQLPAGEVRKIELSD